MLRLICPRLLGAIRSHSNRAPPEITSYVPQLVSTLIHSTRVHGVKLCCNLCTTVYPGTYHLRPLPPRLRPEPRQSDLVVLRLCAHFLAALFTLAHIKRRCFSDLNFPPPYFFCLEAITNPYR